MLYCTHGRFVTIRCHSDVKIICKKINVQYNFWFVSFVYEPEYYSLEGTNVVNSQLVILIGLLVNGV